MKDAIRDGRFETGIRTALASGLLRCAPGEDASKLEAPSRVGFMSKIATQRGVTDVAVHRPALPCRVNLRPSHQLNCRHPRSESSRFALETVDSCFPMHRGSFPRQTYPGSTLHCEAGSCELTTYSTVHGRITNEPEAPFCSAFAVEFCSIVAALDGRGKAISGSPSPDLSSSIRSKGQSESSELLRGLPSIGALR